MIAARLVIGFSPHLHLAKRYSGERRLQVALASRFVRLGKSINARDISRSVAQQRRCCRKARALPSVRPAAHAICRNNCAYGPACIRPTSSTRVSGPEVLSYWRCPARHTSPVDVHSARPREQTFSPAKIMMIARRNALEQVLCCAAQHTRSSKWQPTCFDLNIIFSALSKSLRFFWTEATTELV